MFPSRISAGNNTTERNKPRSRKLRKYKSARIGITRRSIFRSSRRNSVGQGWLAASTCGEGQISCDRVSFSESISLAIQSVRTGTHETGKEFTRLAALQWAQAGFSTRGSTDSPPAAGRDAMWRRGQRATGLLRTHRYSLGYSRIRLSAEKNEQIIELPVGLCTSAESVLHCRPPPVVNLAMICIYKRYCYKCALLFYLVTRQYILKTVRISNMAEYARFPCLPDDAEHEDGSPVLNRHSAFITRGHDFPAAKVSL